MQNRRMQLKDTERQTYINAVVEAAQRAVATAKRVKSMVCIVEFLSIGNYGQQRIQEKATTTATVLLERRSNKSSGRHQRSDKHVAGASSKNLPVATHRSNLTFVCGVEIIYVFKIKIPTIVTYYQQGNDGDEIFLCCHKPTINRRSEQSFISRSIDTV